MIKAIITDGGSEFSGFKRGGILVSTQEAKTYTPARIFLVDSNGSPNMNVNGAASGATDGIHDGTDSSLWTAGALAGTWDFASTAQAKAGTKSIDASGTINGDQALFSRASSIAAGGYAVLTGSVYLDTYNASKHQILLQLRLAGIDDGGSVNIGDYIDRSVAGAWQDFSIPVSALGATGNIDELVVTTVNSGGVNPDYYLDELYLKQSGGLSYKVNIEPGGVVQYKTVEITLADALSSVVTVAGATENSTGAGLSYDAFLGLAALSGGVTFRRTSSKGVVTSGSLSTLGDILTGGGKIVDHLYDGTNTFLRLSVDFADWVELSESAGDTLEAVVNDDLTGLLDFKMAINARILED